MYPNINDLTKLVKKNNKTITHLVIQKSIRIDHYYCSTYIEKQNTLVKGQLLIYETSDTIGAKLVFFDLKSGKVRGASRISIFY